MHAVKIQQYFILISIGDAYKGFGWEKGEKCRVSFKEILMKKESQFVEHLKEIIDSK